MNFYISDLHLNHNNIIKFDRKEDRFFSVEQMNQIIINNWNSVVKPGDNVYILGDFDWGKEEKWIQSLNQMKGNKHLILGNHDLDKFSSKLKQKFSSISNYKEIGDFVGEKKIKVIMSHYPMLAFNKSYSSGVIHLFGHVHWYTDEARIAREFIKQRRTEVKEGYTNRGQMVNVGASCPYMDYTPRTLEYLWVVMKNNIDLIF